MSKRPEPPSFLGRQTVRQATNADLFLEKVPVHNKLWQRQMICLIMLVGEITGGGFETHKGDKTHGFITKTSLQMTKTYNLNTHPLFSLLCFSLLFPTHSNISLTAYLYINQRDSR